MNFRKINRVIHRDLGYFFTGLVIIYSISGIALNHIREWNSNYIITKSEFFTQIPQDSTIIDTDYLSKLFEEQGESKILSFYYPREGVLKAFVKNGTITVNTDTGRAEIEKIRKRPFFRELNIIHYNPGKWWTAVSDIFAVALIIITTTGLFIVKGKNGITRRGAFLVAAGLILPLLALLLI